MTGTDLSCHSPGLKPVPGSGLSLGVFPVPGGGGFQAALMMGSALRPQDPGCPTPLRPAHMSSSWCLRLGDPIKKTREPQGTYILQMDFEHHMTRYGNCQLSNTRQAYFLYHNQGFLILSKVLKRANHSHSPLPRTLYQLEREIKSLMDREDWDFKHGTLENRLIY